MLLINISIVISFMNISVKIAAIGANIGIFYISQVIILGTWCSDISVLAVTADPRCRGSWL